MIRFIDGFDHYPTADILKKWDTVGSATTVGGVGRFSSQGVHMGDGGSLTKFVGSSQTLIAGFAFRPNQIPGADRTIFSFTEGGVDQLCLNLSSTGALYVSRTGTVGTRSGVIPAGGTATSALSAGAYYFIEFKAKISNAVATGDVEVRVGGVPVIQVTAGEDCQTTSNAWSDGIHLGFGSYGLFSTNWDVDFDDLNVIDTAGSTNNTFIGDMRVEVIYPTGDGSHTAFTIAGSSPAATKWQSVNEHPQDGDVTFIQSATPGAIETFTFGSLSTTPTSIAAVQINALCRKDDAGTRTGCGVVRVSGTDYLSTSFGVGDAYALTRSVFEQNPATTSAWTPTTVNALEAGLKLVQ